MMTEEEAKEKWCPHVRFGVDQGDGSFLPPINRARFKDEEDVLVPTACRCIG